MIDQKILFASAVAAYLYVISPGPAFLALFTLAASKGRASGAWFICGHLVGDVTWGSACGRGDPRRQPAGGDPVRTVGRRLRALSHLSRRAGGDDAQGRAAAHDRRAPPAGDRARLRPHQPQGLSGRAGDVLRDRRALCRRASPQPTRRRLLVAAFAGFLAADATLIFAAGLPAVRRFFLTHGVIVTRVVGLIFIAFGAKSLYDAASGAMRRAA